MAARDLLSFPNPVNERAARVVAAGVLVQALVFLVTRQGWLLVPLTYGFIARVLTGPKLSPLGQLATRVVAPRLPWPAVLVPGPPKRFAQAIGAVLTVAASVTWLAGGHLGALVLVAMLVVAAGLESIFAICLGCTIFGWLIRAGVVPETVCEACNDLSLRPTVPAAARVARPSTSVASS
jgi:hypothetical protein